MSLNAPKDLPVPASDGLHFGIACACFNSELTDPLLTRVTSLLEEAGSPASLVVERVPGSHEVPVALALMLAVESFDCLLGLGVVIKGATSHHHLVAESAGHALQRLAVERCVPVINGLIVTDTVEDARERVSGALDRGAEFARAALQMAALKRKWTKNSN